MKYEEVNTPEELLEFMCDNFSYGINVNNKIYDMSNKKEFNEIFSKYWTFNKSNLLETKYGVCWDFVELERDWFKSHNYNFETIFIWFEFDYPNTYSTHTYLIYEDNGYFNLFEYSDTSSRGIHKFNTREEAIKYQKQIHIKHNKENNLVGNEEIKHIHIYSYGYVPEGVNKSEYIDYILDHSKEV